MSTHRCKWCGREFEGMGYNGYTYCCQKCYNEAHGK